MTATGKTGLNRCFTLGYITGVSRGFSLFFICIFTYPSQKNVPVIKTN